MYANLDKPPLWKADIALSIDMYNDWFMHFAPVTFREQRAIVSIDVARMFEATLNLVQIEEAVLAASPKYLAALRMCCAPPLARDRLMGLARVRKSTIEGLEGRREPLSLTVSSRLEVEIQQICSVIQSLIDTDLFPWLPESREVYLDELPRAIAVVADRLCGAQANPIIRNAQERRQLAVIRKWLIDHGYTEERPTDFREMAAGTFATRLNVIVPEARIPIDVVVMPRTSLRGDLPLLIEAKSAGDVTNTNKRRKEEAQKFTQLKNAYGNSIRFVLFLCGYFNAGYLGYEAAEGIDWVWEHRIEDFAILGV